MQLRDPRAFTRNPLGVIGLFIVLIYGMAVVVAGFSRELSDVQRWVMVGLVALFPVIVLCVFFRLVTVHHPKLYAPRDWEDERLFLVAAGSYESEEKWESEVAEIERAEAQAGGPKDETAQEPPEPALKPGPNVGEIRRLVQKAEEGVFRRLENEYAEDILREVSLTVGGQRLRLDGVVADHYSEPVSLIEVKLIRNLRSSGPILERTAKTAQQLARMQGFDRDPEFVLALVTVDANRAEQHELVRQAQRALRAVPMRSRVRVFDLQELEDDTENS